MKKLISIILILFSLSAISQIRIDQTKSVSAAGTIGIGKTIFANGSGGWTFETIPAGGTITGVTAGVGLSGGGTSGSVTLDLLLGKLSNDNTAILTDYIPWTKVSTSTDKKMTIQTLKDIVSKWSGTTNLYFSGNVGVGAQSEGPQFHVRSYWGGSVNALQVNQYNSTGKLINAIGTSGLSDFAVLNTGQLQLRQITAPTTPITGYGHIYQNLDKKLFFINDAGTQYDLTATGFSNPMTSVGDLIRGGTSGSPTRLGIGTNGQFLSVAGGLPAWLDAPNMSGWFDNGSAVNLINHSRNLGIGVSSDISRKINVLSSSGTGIYSYNSPNVAIQGETTTGTGLYGYATGSAGTAIYGLASGASGVALWGKSTHVNGFGFIAQNNAGGSAGLLNVEPSSTNTTQKVVTIQRFTTGTAAIGIGSSIEFDTEISDGGGFITGNIDHYLQNVTAGSVSSEFRLKTMNNGTMISKEITAQFNINRFSTGTYTTTEQTGTVINQGNSTGFALDASPQHGQIHTLINQYTSQVNCSTYYNYSNATVSSVPANSSITVQYDATIGRWYQIK